MPAVVFRKLRRPQMAHSCRSKDEVVVNTWWNLLIYYMKIHNCDLWLQVFIFPVSFFMFLHNILVAGLNRSDMFVAILDVMYWLNDSFGIFHNKPCFLNFEGVKFHQANFFLIRSYVIYYYGSMGLLRRCNYTMHNITGHLKCCK